MPNKSKQITTRLIENLGEELILPYTTNTKSGEYIAAELFDNFEEFYFDYGPLWNEGSKLIYQ